MPTYQLEGEDRYFANCRARKHHWHSWQGGKCPLPEGLLVEVIRRDGKSMPADISFLWDWSHANESSDIIAFKVLGPAEGWKYEWEE